MTIMKKPIFITFTFLIFYFLFLISNTYSQITRGAVPGELYISTGWFADEPGVRYGIFHTTDNGSHITPMYSNLETPPPGEMAVGLVLGDATPGVLYNYGINELWVSFDEGVSWAFREDYPGYTQYFTGVNQGLIFKGNFNGFFKSTNYGWSFDLLPINVTCPFTEVGFYEPEFFGIDGEPGINFDFVHTIDYGQTYTEIPIDSAVAYWSIGGYWPQISRGTEPGELYLVSWWLDYHYKIFHSVDTGYTWTEQYESDYIDTFYWRVAYTAGREPGSFYVKRSRINPAGTHVWLYIDYSSDYGQTFTSYFHDLVPDFTSVNSIEKPNIRLSNDPNPFSDQTTIHFRLPKNANNPLLNVYDLHGKLIRQFAVGGKSEQPWDGTDDNGNRLPAGIYLYNITYNNTSTALQKAIILN